MSEIVKRTALIIGAVAISCGTTFFLSAGHGSAADSKVGGELQIDAKSFRCITKMTPVRHFYVDNLRGDLAATLAAANSPTGAVYPPGSVVQLVPGEVMVKRDKGTDHGCAPIPVTRAMTGALQRTDPRCDNPPPSPADAAALKQLNELLKPPR